MVYSRGESFIHCNKQMISNKEMAIASASTDAIRAKGQDFFYRFWLTHEDEVTSYQSELSLDPTNFSAFGSERRQQMLNEYALGVVYLSSLSDDEKAGVATIAQRQYQQNTEVVFTWLICGGVIISLLAAIFAGIGSREKDAQNTSLMATTEISRLA